MVWAASFSPDGARIVTASSDHTARIWDAQTGQPIGEPLHHNDQVRAASFSPDGTRIVTASVDHTARIWDAQTGQPIGEPLRHGAAVWSANFSPDGTRIVTASADDTARVWDAETGHPVGGPLRHRTSVRSASFSPDGTRIVTASVDSTARIWDAQTGQPIGEPLRHDAAAWTASFSPDGTRIVTTSADHTARIWNAQTGEPIGQPLHHDDKVQAASFSPDGTRIVTASIDQTARIWDAQTGNPIGQPLRSDDKVSTASFSPDGTRIVTASLDHTARIWDVRVDLKTAIPEWLPVLLEALGRRRLNEDGSLVDAREDLFEARYQLLSLKDDTFWSRLGHWLVTTGSDRTIAPNSKITIREWEKNQLIATGHLYEYSFATLDPSWGTPSEDWSVQNGKLTITPGPAKSRQVLNQSKIFDDAELSVEVNMSAGDDVSRPGGLVFWSKGYGDGYLFLISADGQFAIGRWFNNGWLPSTGWQDSAAINNGVGQINKLRVVTKEGQATAYINGQQVAVISGDSPRGGFIGLYGESAEKSENTWQFSNLEVIIP
jgi:WD40 repeat protein